MKPLLSRLRAALLRWFELPAEKELQTILQNIQDIYYRVDKEGMLVRVSDSVEDLLGYTPAEVIGTRMADYYVDPNGREKFLQTLREADGSINNYDVLLRHKNGSEVWISTNSHFYCDSEGEIAGVEGIARNITELKSHINELYKLSTILEHTADMVMVTGPDGIIEYVNHAFERITGYSSKDVIGKTPAVLNSGEHDTEEYAHLWKTINAGEVYRNVLINKRKDGTLFYEEKTITPLKDENGKIIHFISTAKDISDRIQAHKRLHHMAHHDALTGLPNRTLFLDRLEQALHRALLHTRLVAVLFLDLDRFKNINDTLGHNVGDELLVQLTERLTQNIRYGDTIGRFGGDEFVILLDDLENERYISSLAQKILDTLINPFIINNHELYITASIGISIYPSDGHDTETLLRNADIAMYRAKDLGKNNYQFYSDDMSARIFERLTLENHLRHALERDEFVLHYQPQVDAQTQRIHGVEALLRWQHPEIGLVSPPNFIPLLEETGLIEEVGDWLLESACKQSRQWHDTGSSYLHMSVNLSSRQFNNPAFFDSIQKIIRQTGINPEFLELEITESMLMRNASSTINALDTLSQLGVRFAIDDFGTGYSSLNYLRRFPIDTIKIDRSFIRDITTDEDDAAITSAIIVMAHSLSMNVIAEGVENDSQLAFLQEHNCHYIQGHFFSHALPAEEITHLLQKQNV